MTDPGKFHPSQRRWPLGMPESISQTEHKELEKCVNGSRCGFPGMCQCHPDYRSPLNLVEVSCPNECGYRVRVDESVREYNLGNHVANCDAPRRPQEASGDEDREGPKDSPTLESEDLRTAYVSWVSDRAFPTQEELKAIRPLQTIVEFPSGLKRDSTEGKINYLLTRDGPLLKRWAELLSRGAVVKGKRNWLKAGSNPDTAYEDLERFREGAARHFEQWLAGETDEDHAAAVVFNINGAEHVKGQME